MPTRANKITKSELAYIAGIIDGEGSISVEKRSLGRKFPVYCITMTIVNTDIRLVSWLKERIGGCLIKKYTEPGHNWNQQYQLQVRSKTLEAILPSIRPFLLLKGEQADIVMSFKKVFGLNGCMLDDETRSYREQLYQRARQLNIRGKGRYGDAERLSEEGPLVEAEHATVRSHGNSNHENVVEISTSKRVG